MANLIVTHNFAHRMSKFGTLESAQFEDGAITGEFELRKDTDMNLSGGDISELIGMLSRLDSIIYEDYRAPSNAKPTDTMEART